MIPYLYNSDETQFVTEGIGRLVDCISCTVREQRNGVYECEFQYPITGRHFNDIADGKYIAVTHDDTGDIQPFIIYGHEKPMNGIVTFYAHHVSYMLNHVMVAPFTSSSASQALVNLKGNSINRNAFDFWTDKTTQANMTLKAPASARAVLGGVHGAILDVYGGEYEWDRFTVKLHTARGADRGVEIRYGKNLVDITQGVDLSNAYNALVPYWYNDDENILVTVDGYIVGSTGGDDLPVSMDLSAEFDEQPTPEQLQAKAQQILEEQKAWLPKPSIDIDFVDLWNTPEYEQYKVLQMVSLCDTVTVHYKELGVENVKVKVIETEYNVLKDRYNNLKLGEPRSTFGETLVKDLVDNVKQIQASLNSYSKKSFLDQAIENATELITGGLGGNLVIGRNSDGQPNELYIMNTDNVETATQVLRINLNGIGFSSDGYEGPYRTAWTLDGRFVADFITAGTLNANIIRAGTLTGGDGTNFWNLDTGEMNISGDSLDIVAGDKVSLYVQGTVQDAIDDIEVGTRNYLRGTPKSYTPAAYRFIEIPLTEALEEDATYTFQAWDLNLDANSSGTVLYWGGGSNRIYPVSGQMKPNAKGYLKCTFTITAAQARHAQAANLWLQLYNYPNGHEGTNATIGKWMLEKSSIASDWKPAPEDTETEIADFTEAVNQSIQDIQDQLDGVVDTWYYDYTPTASNYPANEWTTEELKQDHEGDLFLNTDTGVSYRWLKENGVWYWKEIPDTAAATALQMAREAKDTADNKRRVFIRVPYVPYDEGDIWFQGESGDILTCTTAKTAQQTYDRTDWSKLSKYDTYIDFQTPFEWNASGTVATFTAKVYRSNADVTDEFDATSFKWYLRNEDNVEETLITIGKTCTVNASDLGYGSTVIGEFTTYERTYLTTAEGIYLTTADGSRLISLEEL